MNTLLAVLLAGWAAAATAEKPKLNTQTMQEAYDQAFKAYQSGDYRKAISKWNDILRSDPTQSSAQRMIEQAREAMASKIKQYKAKVNEHIGLGRYRDALLDMQKIIDLDPSDSHARRLASRLEQVSEIVPAAPVDAGKAWRVAAAGLRGFLSLPQDLKLAHNGLRYALELSPGVPEFPKLLTFLRAEFPQLTDDDVTPGMKLLEHKRLVALHHIYDTRYHAAIPVLNEILQLEPNDVTALKQLGSAFFSLGKKPQARDAWNRALRLAPNDATLKEFLARIN